MSASRGSSLPHVCSLVSSYTQPERFLIHDVEENQCFRHTSIAFFAASKFQCFTSATQGLPPCRYSISILFLLLNFANSASRYALTKGMIFSGVWGGTRLVRSITRRCYTENDEAKRRATISVWSYIKWGMKSPNTELPAHFGRNNSFSSDR